MPATEYDGEVIADMTELRAKEAVSELVDKRDELVSAQRTVDAQAWAERSYAERKAKRRSF